MTDVLDALIVGAGPGGLSCALNLARCMRKIAIFDDGVARNDVAREVHGFITRDGAAPGELKRIAREELMKYGVEVRRAHVDDVKRVRGGFEIDVDGTTLTARKLVLATGLVDTLPEIEGFESFYGTSIWHCPHCDGYEARGRKLAVLANGKESVGLALSMRVFTDDVILLTNGVRLDDKRRDKCGVHTLRCIDKAIVRFEGRAGQLEYVVFDDGERLARNGLFFHLGTKQRSDLPAKLGCEFDRHGEVVRMNRGEESSSPGVYVVGDASEDARLIVVAAAEGAKAAVHIHKRLREEDDFVVEKNAKLRR
jgi:thioredoxin reductase